MTMNERYIFRGRRVDNGEWVEGSLAQHADGKLTIQPIGDTYWLVDPATVGQCTSLRDRNGRLIFEGDVVKYFGSDYRIWCGAFNVNPRACAEAYWQGWYMECIKGMALYELVPLYAEAGVAVRFPAHVAGTEAGREKLKLEVVGTIHDGKKEEKAYG